MPTFLRCAFAVAHFCWHRRRRRPDRDLELRRHDLRRELLLELADGHRPNASAFATTYHISQVVVTVRYLISTFPSTSPTRSIRPARRHGRALGPLPIIIQDDYVVYPPPPESPGLSAT